MVTQSTSVSSVSLSLAYTTGARVKGKEVKGVRSLRAWRVRHELLSLVSVPSNQEDDDDDDDDDTEEKPRPNKAIMAAAIAC